MSSLKIGDTENRDRTDLDDRWNQPQMTSGWRAAEEVAGPGKL